MWVRCMFPAWTRRCSNVNGRSTRKCARDRVNDFNKMQNERRGGVKLKITLSCEVDFCRSDYSKEAEEI